MLCKACKIIAMVQSDHRNASLIHSHIAVLRFVFFPLAHRNVFSIHSRMASEADLLKLNIVRSVMNACVGLWLTLT